VKGVTHLAKFEKLHKEFKDHPKVQHLNMPASMVCAKDAVSQCDSFVGQLEHTQLPATTSVLVETMNKHIETLATAMKRVRRFTLGLQSLKMSKGRITMESKRAWRTGRDAYCKALKGRGVYACVSKQVADCCMCIESPPDKASLTITYAERMFSLEDTVDDDYYDDPRKLLDASNPHASHWAKEAAAFLEKNADEIKTSLARCAREVAASSGRGGTTTVIPKVPFTVKGPGEGEAFYDGAISVRPIVGHIERVHFDVSPQVFPLTGWRCVLTCISDTLIVLVLSAEQFASHGGSLKTFLQKEGSAALQENDMFVLKAGESVYIPLGCVPLLIGCKDLEFLKYCGKAGLPKKEKEKLAADLKQTTTWVGHFFPHVKIDGKAPLALRNQLVATMVQAGAQVPDSIRSNAEVKAWREAMEQSEESGAAQGAGQ